jgi:GTP cyclohydrolase II
MSQGRIPIKESYGQVKLFYSLSGHRRHVAVLFDGTDISAPVPVRVHSLCFTGDVLGSLRCDCGVQLEKSIEFFVAHGGVLLYMDQEGRGIGLSNKLSAYQLQDSKDLDTVDANLHQGLPDDARYYDEAAEILNVLGIKKISLLSNNPSKAKALEKIGIDVVESVRHHFSPTSHNHAYLETKKNRMGHDF